MSNISVIVITKDEEKNIKDCLESVKWANEIILVDDGSTDRTLEIAKTYTDKIFYKPWTGYGAAKNFAISKCSSEWILWIDADERVTPELKEEIIAILNKPAKDVVAYRVPRLANFLGAWIRHCGWYPGRVTRLFRRQEGAFSEDKVHEKLLISGKIKKLHANLLHFTDPNIEHYYNKFNKYTSLAAEDIICNKKHFHLYKLIFNPIWVFIKMYFIKFGFLDGIAGLILCLSSANYVFIKYAKVWELQKKSKGV